MIAELTAIMLVCDGVSITTPSQTPNSQYADGFHSQNAHSRLNDLQRINERLHVEIDGDVVRVKMPPSMEPAIAGRGEDGWRTLTDTAITPDFIRGRLSYNWINRPSVIIDRRTGAIDVTHKSRTTTLARFEGACQRLETWPDRLF